LHNHSIWYQNRWDSLYFYLWVGSCVVEFLLLLLCVQLGHNGLRCWIDRQIVSWFGKHCFYLWTPESGAVFFSVMVSFWESNCFQWNYCKSGVRFFMFQINIRDFKYYNVVNLSTFFVWSCSSVPEESLSFSYQGVCQRTRKKYIRKKNNWTTKGEKNENFRNYIYKIYLVSFFTFIIYGIYWKYWFHSHQKNWKFFFAQIMFLPIKSHKTWKKAIKKFPSVTCRRRRRRCWQKFVPRLQPRP
jgi:hypothetical protein